MKKTIVAVLLVLMLVFGTTAFAADTFDPSALIHITAQEGFSKTGALTGDGYYTLTDDRTILFELDGYGYCSMNYCCTPDNGATWDSFLNHENDIYSSAAYIMKIKNGAAEVGITPANIAFDSNGQTAYICINGYEDAPILLIDNEGNAVLTEAYYSIDRYFVTIPANFDGYLYVPYERLTYDLSEENVDTEASMMSLHTDEEYRLFWTLGMCIENLAEDETSFEFQGVYLSATALDLEYSEEGIAPTQTDNTTGEPGQATDAPTDVPSAPAGGNNGFPVWIIIVAAVVVVAVVVVIIIVSKKKK